MLGFVRRSFRALGAETVKGNYSIEATEEHKTRSAIS